MASSPRQQKPLDFKKLERDLQTKKNRVQRDASPRRDETRAEVRARTRRVEESPVMWLLRVETKTVGYAEQVQQRFPHSHPLNAMLRRHVEEMRDLLAELEEEELERSRAESAAGGGAADAADAAAASPAR